VQRVLRTPTASTAPFLAIVLATIFVAGCAGIVSPGSTTTGTGSPAAAKIMTQPANQSVSVGQTATFLVTASGTAPLSYQWRKNSVAVSGATGASYTTPPAASSDTGSKFDVVVSNSVGNATSNPATLTVNAAGSSAPQITMPPTNQTVNVGQAATFSVTATGTAPLSYQWQKNSVNIAGANSSTYTTPATISTDTGSKFDDIVRAND
jgi:hypothetical protein